MQTLILNHMLYDIVQNLIILSLCLTIVYPKAIERYRRRKKLRETQAIKERQEEIRKVIEEVLKDLVKE